MSGTEHMSAKEFLRQFAGKETQVKAPGSKYHNEITEAGGRKHASKAEARRYADLCLMLKGGAIQGFTCQPSFELFQQDGTSLRYRPDFMVKGNDGAVWVEDVKGYTTDVFRIKELLWRHNFPWLPLKVLRKE